MNDHISDGLNISNFWTVEALNQILADLQADALQRLLPGRSGPPADLLPEEDWLADESPAPPVEGERALCPTLPLKATITNPKYLFLREIGGASCLKPFLDGVIAAGPNGPDGHWGGTLIIDQPIVLGFPIQIPAEFTLAGVGIHGDGRITFKGFSGPAITFQENPDPPAQQFGGKSILRDIAIAGPGIDNQMGGFKVGSTRFVNDFAHAIRALTRFQFHSVRISGFGDFGIQGGMHTYAVVIDRCELLDNRANIQLISQCGSWRIRDCIISGAKLWGIDVGVELKVGPHIQPGALTDVLITGCRFTNNAPGAIRVQPGHNKSVNPPAPEDDQLNDENVDQNVANKPLQNTTTGVIILGNRFENNTATSHTAVQIDQAKVFTVPSMVSPQGAHRIVENYFDPGELLILPLTEDPTGMKDPAMTTVTGTHIGFNTSVRKTVSDPISDVLNTFKATRMSE